MILIHDLHIGVLRSAGTLPTTALALRQNLLDNFEKILSTVDEDLVVLGDLMDTGGIPMGDLLATYRLLDTWLTKGHKLTLVNGNHDLNTDSSKLSSFQFLAALLSDNPNVTHVSKGQLISEGVYVIPHVLNQDRFDIEVSQVPTCKYLLLHCNYDNFHATGDHSLNLSEQQAKDCKAEFIVVAHEHHSRQELKGKVYIPGNQFPSSVSDCLDKKDKTMTRLGDKPEPIKTWSKKSYQELDWRNPVKSDAQFIRFTGFATAENAADMANVIARYRKDSQAFVVSNAVKVGENAEAVEMTASSLEAIRGFDVMAALKDLLTKEENEILESLT